MAKKRLLILGMGLQGKGALYDAVKSGLFASITVADMGEAYEAQRQGYEAQGAKTVTVNAENLESVRLLIQNADVVIELLPVRFALQIGRIAAEIAGPGS